MSHITQLQKLCEREERICFALTRSLTDLAFELLRLAQLEIVRDDGSAIRAAELIASAERSRAAAREFLDEASPAPGPESEELEEHILELSQAIHAADWQRRRATDSTARGLRLVVNSNGTVN